MLLRTATTIILNLPDIPALIPSPPGGEGRVRGASLTTQLARALRKNMTDAERRLWYLLRNRQLWGWKFRRQHPVGPYIADFVCLEKKVVIEVDGGQHGENEDADWRRTSYLNKMGYQVLRFWNHEVLQEIDAVMDTIFDTLEDLPPHPGPLPPPGGEGVF